MAMEFYEEHISIVLVSVNGGESVFDIKFKEMDDTPFYKRPSFYIASWLVFLFVVYGWQIRRMGGLQAGIVDILIDLACLFPLLLVLWMAFFAQFVLPVRKFSDRQKIFDRLITYLFGGHGPALFIENGIIQEHSGERLKKGPGVVWLDSASAAVTRTATAIKQTLGPGVHFLESREYIAGTLDLHNQSHTVGPSEKDEPFEPRRDDQDPEAYKQIQDRRKQVSALTRDGIEIVPSITVNFRVDTGFPRQDQPGSRFGYRKGVTKKDREREEQDKQAIRKAILGEGVNPLVEPDSPRNRVAWNQLPAALAVDLWREYAAKFTLDELFAQTQIVPPPAAQPPQPTEEEVEALGQSVRVGGTRQAMQSTLTSMLQRINDWMQTALDVLEETPEEKPAGAAPLPVPTAAKTAAPEPTKTTALHVINEMVNARLTQPEVEILDDHGVRLADQSPRPSPEYRLLQERGLKVLGVSISGLKLNPEIENALINRWSATWLKNAKGESEQIERKRNIVESTARDKAIREHAAAISSDIIHKKPVGVKETLRNLLMCTRAMILKRDELRKRMTAEEQELEDIIKWIEVNGT